MRVRAGLCATVAALATGLFMGRTPAATTWGSGAQTPRYMYVSSLEDGTVSVYSIETSTGKLRPRGYVVTGGSGISVTADPTGRSLVAATFGSADQLRSYSIGASGNLTHRQTATPYPGPNDAAFTNDGARLFWPNLDQFFVTKYDFDAANGTFTTPGTVTSAGVWPETVVVHPTLSVCYVPNYITEDLYTFTIGAGGTLTENVSARRSLPAGSGPISAAVSPNGSWLYVACYETSGIVAYSLNGSGVPSASPLTGSPYTNANMVNPSSIVVDESSRFVYTANDGSNTVSYFRIGTSPNGELLHNQSVAAGTNPSRLSHVPSGNRLYCLNRVSNDITAYSINTGTGGSRGQLTTIGTWRTHRQPFGVAVAGGSGTVTYTPRFAYCTNQDDDTISVYTVNSTTGALTAANPATVSSGGDQPLYAQIHPDGTHLFVCNRGDGNATQRGIRVYSINATTGALTAIGGLVGTDQGPRRFAIDPTGRFVYVAHDTAQTIGCYSFDASTGSLTRLAGAAGTVNVGEDLWGITVDPAGLYVLLPVRSTNSTRAYAIDVNTGALTLASTSAAQGSDPRCCDVDPTGRFALVCNLASPDTSSYRFDSAGTWTTVGTLNSNGTQSIQIAVEPTGRWAYAANFGTGDVTKYTINQTTGALSNPVITDCEANPQGLTVDPSGRFLYVPNAGDDSISVYTIDAGDGDLSEINGSPFNCGNRPHTVIVMGTVQ